jgi:hypothetical protein
MIELSSRQEEIAMWAKDLLIRELRIISEYHLHGNEFISNLLFDYDERRRLIKERNP